MVKNSDTLNWKPVKLDGAVTNDLDGLVGIEECTNYDLNGILQHKNKRRKQAVNDKLDRDDEFDKPTLKKTKTEEIDPKSRGKLAIKNTKKKSANKIQDCISPSKQGSTYFDYSVEVAKNKLIEAGDSSINLPAWERFGLPKPLLKAIKEQGFDEPTEIQNLTLLPAILGRRDILGAAETGSGKTLAFGLPIITAILKIKELEKKKQPDNSEPIKNEEYEEVENFGEFGCVKVIDNIEIEESKPKNPLYALILTPTRELAIQVKNHLVAVAKYTGIKIAVVLGGMAVVKQERILSKGPEIVVATPGRLWELIQEGNSHLSQIDEIRFLAIDETDRMMERGHFQELNDIIERLNANKFKQKQRQNFVFSATLTLVHELPKHLVLKRKLNAKNSKQISIMTVQEKLQQIVDILGITNPKIVDITKKSGTASTLSECRITCAAEEKDFYVYYFLQQHVGRTLIFCNSIGCVKRLTTLLGLLGCKPMALHASMQQRQRLKNLDRFRTDEHAILIATDVAARGLDIPFVEHVLHYQTPRTSEGYVHRSGRTARASKTGITILLVDPTEIQNYLRLCRTLGRSEDLPLFPVQERTLTAVKERVRLARELDKLELQVRKANSENGWIQKAAEEMDIVVDDELPTKYDMEESRTFKKTADIKRKQLVRLLSQPLFPKGFSGKYPLVSSQLGMSLVLTEPKNKKAVDVLKNSIEESINNPRKKAKWLFKSKALDRVNKEVNGKSLKSKKQNNNRKKYSRNNKNHKKKLNK